MEEDDDIRWPVWAKLALFAGLLIVPTGLVGVALMEIAESTLKTDGRDYRLALAEDIAETVESSLNDGKEGLVGVAQLLSDPELREADRIELALNVVESNELLDHAYVYDRTGEPIDRLIRGDVDPPGSEALSEELRERATDRELAVGSVVSGAEGVRAMTAVPIRDPEGEVTGYVAAHLPLRPVQKRVEFVSDYRIASSENPVYVVDDQLRIVAHPEERRARELAAAPTHALLENVEGDQMERGVAQSGEFETSSGRRMLATVQPLQGLPWAVVIEEPLEVAYASLYRMRRVVWGVTGAALVVALGAAFLLGRRLTEPVGKLVEKARQLAEREFDEEVEVDTRDELRVLGRAMNRAGQDLKESEERIREETEIRADLGRYLPEGLVDGIVRRERSIDLGGERREISVLFADVVRFTPLCEELEPGAVVSILNELFTIQTEIAFRHDGTVDKFIGDAIMAFWGAPEPVDDHADAALEAAEDMIRWLDIGNDRWREEHDVEIEIAIGVHTGEAIVGNIGSETRMEYTAIGRNVNVAARLEALANPQQILTTPATRAEAGSGFEFREVGRERFVTAMGVEAEDGEPTTTSTGEIEVLEVVL
jgi:class 3 adenylate cyclase